MWPAKFAASWAKSPARRQVGSQATLANRGRNWMIACEGVEIDPWAIVDQAEPSDLLANVRTKAAMDGPADW